MGCSTPPPLCCSDIMTFQVLSLDVHIGLAAFAAIACHFVYTKWLNPKRHLPLPPGPTRLPLVGNIHQIPIEYQHETFADWARKYGTSDFIYKTAYNNNCCV